MRFVQKSALRAVPEHATVGDGALANVEERLGEEGDELQKVLDGGYREMDRKQPALAEWLADQVAEEGDDLAQSLGYFLAVTVYMAFSEAFPTRLDEVDEVALSQAVQTLAADEELRANDGSEHVDSDDVVAMSQPALIRFVRHHLDEALEQAGESPDLAAFDRIYRSVLVEVIALSHSVRAPDGSRRSAAILA